MERLRQKNTKWAMSNYHPIYIADYHGYEITIYTHTLKLVPPDSEYPTDSVLFVRQEQETLRKAHKIAIEIVNAYNLNVVQEKGIMLMYLVRQELAETENKLAKEAIERKSKIVLVHPDTNKECFKIDESVNALKKKGKEAEFVRPDSNHDHKTKFDEFYNDVLHRDAWRKLKIDSMAHRKEKARLDETQESLADAAKILLEEVRVASEYRTESDFKFQQLSSLITELAMRPATGLDKKRWKNG